MVAYFAIMVTLISSSSVIEPLICLYRSVIIFIIALSILRFELVLFLSLAEPYGPITRLVFKDPRFVGAELGGVVGHY
jgi:hypothetical protein